MHLQKITLSNFKNYSSLDLSFDKRVNFLWGENGSGKTNLLDAIYYLSMTKSAFNGVDHQNMSHGSDFFMIKASININEKKHEVLCNLQKNKKKEVKIDRKPYERVSDHIGRLPVVLIAPNDTDLLREGSEIRRKFFDSIISQIDKNYLDTLIRYHHLLKQRNSLLKQFKERNKVDHDLLDTYDVKIIDWGKQISDRRAVFIKEFRDIFCAFFAKISGNQEQVDISYQSDFTKDDYEVLFNNSRERDIILQRTTFGVHRDDFIFTMEGRSIKKFGSQGQQKSYVISLKLSHYEIVRSNKKFNPIMLLDDIFDKLDNQRVANLLEVIIQDDFGQLFITNTQMPDKDKIFKTLYMNADFYEIKDAIAAKVEYLNKK